MFRPYSSLPCRSSNGLRGKKMMPALGALTNPLIERPGNCTALWTPGCLLPISAICRMTRSVRSSVAASGSRAKATRYCLSWGGTEARAGRGGRGRIGELGEGHQVLFVLGRHEAAGDVVEPEQGECQEAGIHGE